MDISIKFSDIIALCAFFLSFYTFRAQLDFAKTNSIKNLDFAKTNSIKNLDAIYFNAIFQNILIYKIPKAQKKIYVNQDGEIQDDKDLINVLNEIRNKSMYFRYSEKDFYDKLVKALQDLEDYIICRLGQKVDRMEFLNKVQEKIENIYDILITQYKKL